MEDVEVPLCLLAHMTGAKTWGEVELWDWEARVVASGLDGMKDSAVECMVRVIVAAGGGG